MIRLIFILILFPFVAFSHKGHNANFVFGEVLKAKTLIISIDKKDLVEVSDIECKKVNFICFDDYIQKNFKIFIDTNKVELELQLENSFIKDDKVVLYYLVWNSSTLDIDSNIKIINTCFNDFDHSYNNNIAVNLLGHEKSFRMTNKRTEIEFKLRD